MEEGTGGPAIGAASIRAAARPGFAARVRHRMERRWHALDLVHDLAEDIGSAHWYRGFGTMLAFSALAVGFWPDMTVVDQATAMTVDSRARDEFRSQTILPLAQGGQSGRQAEPGKAVVPLISAPDRPMVRLVATLGQSDSFSRMLQRAGVGPGDAAQVAAMVAAVMPVNGVAPGTRFDITLGKRAAPGMPRPLDAMRFRARFDMALAIERRDGTLSIERKPIAVDTMPLRIRGVIGNGTGLYRSARAAGAPSEAIQQYLRALDPHVSIDSELAPGDTFDIILAYKRSAQGESEVGPLLYAGLERAGKARAELLRWGGSGSTEDQFYNAADIGQPPEQTAGLFAPVSGRLTSRYGMRMHPVLGYARLHAGIDYGAAWGSPIVAVSDGTVSYAGRRGGHGNYVRLEHGGGMGTGYAHMSRIAVGYGSAVRAGQVIGYVGSTGLSTGPHLHYEVYRGGRTVDPLSVKFAVRARVDPREQALVKQRLVALKRIEPGAALKPLVTLSKPVKSQSAD